MTRSAEATPRLRDLIGLLARLVLGGVILAAGLLKVGHLETSARSVRAYQLLPYDVAGYVGYGLPILEIAVGALLILGLFTRFAAVVGGLLMLVFIAGIASAWARGLSIDCGCFGHGGTIAAAQTQYPQEIARDVGLLLCAAWLVVRPRTAFSVERFLFPE
ncbi:putative membrane protein YphA (DoxX/SURF4 family) [Phycicoccus badiiscoriae]|uniref:Putative membrane protein YphA (DoxX/SURF4 family) n=1 Tax=Pedococcus badiiscoriae TaxID=642776 RepID=A0A852WNA7_9MICO|nr:MauE/DoxX family redox-associated membrane protein [Pedococcus badiiscoriae]NYG08334.1 putative membrane protein YphA (DoxX/SURF4 family) [Pedococcus badiiscoriae]